MTYLQGRRIKQDMDGLSDISSMKIVVIRYTLQIVVFQGGEKVKQGLRNYLKGLEKIS